MPNTRRYEEATRYLHLTSSGIAINRAGNAILHRVVVNNPTAGASLNIFESATAAGEAIALDVDLNASVVYEYGVTLSGLTVEMNPDANITIIFQ